MVTMKWGCFCGLSNVLALMSSAHALISWTQQAGGGSGWLVVPPQLSSGPEPRSEPPSAPDFTGFDLFQRLTVNDDEERRDSSDLRLTFPRFVFGAAALLVSLQLTQIFTLKGSTFKTFKGIFFQTKEGFSVK